MRDGLEAVEGIPVQWVGGDALRRRGADDLHVPASRHGDAALPHRISSSNLNLQPSYGA